MDLGERTNSMAMNFPEKERFNLSFQLIRATESVALNIAEDSIGQSNSEFKRFMEYGIRSLAETVTCLDKAENRMYITKEDFGAVYSGSFEWMNMMTAFKKVIINWIEELRTSGYGLPTKQITHGRIIYV